MSSTGASVSSRTATGSEDSSWARSPTARGRPARLNATAQAAIDARKSAPASSAAPPSAPRAAILLGVMLGCDIQGQRHLRSQAYQRSGEDPGLPLRPPDLVGRSASNLEPVPLLAVRESHARGTGPPCAPA